MSAVPKLPPIVEADRSGAGHWQGSGRYERGDRRDRRLNHWTYGERADHARIRRVLAMLAASWHQIDPDDRRGKRFRTSCRILTEIVRSLNKVDGISYVTKASIAARLNMHRNTIYKHCKAMEQAGVIIQGHYVMPKGSNVKSYSVFGVPGITGRLPVVLRFRRRHARHTRLVQITWPLATIAWYGQRAFPQLSSPVLVTSANENLFKNVHSTCDSQLFLNQAVDPPSQPSRKRLKGESGAALIGRQVKFEAANGGRSVRSVPKPVLKRLNSGEQGGHEGEASRFSTSHHDRQLSATQRVRSVMQAYERDFGHLDNYQPIVGFPRGWMRARVLAISDDEWAALVQLVLARPMLTGGAPMQDGRTFQLNFWWLMQEAPRLLTLLAKSERSRTSTPPPPPTSTASSRQKCLRPGEHRRIIADIRTRSPELATALERLGRSIEEDEK